MQVDQNPPGRKQKPIREFPMRTIILALSAATLTVPMMPAPALAQYSGYHGKTWRDSQGRLRCKRPNGTTALIVGAAGGALVGRAIDTRGERAHGYDPRAAPGPCLVAKSSAAVRAAANGPFRSRPTALRASCCSSVIDMIIHRPRVCGPGRVSCIVRTISTKLSPRERLALTAADALRTFSPSSARCPGRRRAFSPDHGFQRLFVSIRAAILFFAVAGSPSRSVSL